MTRQKKYTPVVSAGDTGSLIPEFHEVRAQYE